MTSVVSVNPATGVEREMEIEETTVTHVRELCRRASLAAPVIAARPLSWRAALLRAMADELEIDAAPLVTVAEEETALSKVRLQGELRRTAFQFRFFARVVDDGAFLAVSIDHATDSPMGPLPDLRRLRVPLGPIGVFGSSNFPFAFSVPGGDTASALAAGCPVVVKAHPAHPATSLATFNALKRAATRSGAPEGLLSIVFGVGAGIALVEDPAITAVGFTGSVSAGRELWRRVNSRSTPIPFYGELGSANPLVVTRGAAAERGSEIGVAIGESMTLGVGQFCTKPGLLFVPKDNGGDALVDSLVNTLRRLGSMTMLTSAIAEQFRQRCLSMTSIQDVSLLVDAKPEGGARVNAHLIEVSVSTFDKTTSQILHDECFGPLAVVVRYETNDELVNALARIEPALTFSVFTTENDNDAAPLVELGSWRAGRVITNGFPTGVGVSWSMQHGGPWPATTAATATSVGAGAIDRWLRPVTFQNLSTELIPEPLRDDNPLGVPQRVDGRFHAGNASSDT